MASYGCTETMEVDIGLGYCVCEKWRKSNKINAFPLNHFVPPPPIPKV